MQAYEPDWEFEETQRGMAENYRLQEQERLRREEQLRLQQEKAEQQQRALKNISTSKGFKEASANQVNTTGNLATAQKYGKGGSKNPKSKKSKIKKRKIKKKRTRKYKKTKRRTRKR